MIKLGYLIAMELITLTTMASQSLPKCCPPGKIPTSSCISKLREWIMKDISTVFYLKSYLST
ncbi:hypothetical protein K2F45_22665 [Sphingobacterium siyangense]|uniref:hypothetical protein n=1 Tax=Sphingobacterium TaxID=28453 RepID=UPI0012FB309F|nr:MULTISPECIES: hypothetical protein [Sphingobacterium]UQA74575.1 hypothetical protein K2F45_22665 [Sphingobacterium siyangense]